MATQQIRTALEAAKNVADASDKVQWAAELRPILEGTLGEIDTLDSTLAARRDVTVPIEKGFFGSQFQQAYYPNRFQVQDCGYENETLGTLHQYPIFVKTDIAAYTMFTIRARGYHLGIVGETIDFVFAGYAYESQDSMNATRKKIIRIAFSKNSDFDFSVGIGISDDGFVTLKIGNSASQWYYLFLNFDVEIHFNNWSTIVPPLGNWSVQNTPVTFVDYHDLTATILKKTMTYAERMLLTPPLRAVGIEVYQTDTFGNELEGKYVYKSTGWAYLG